MAVPCKAFHPMTSGLSDSVAGEQGWGDTPTPRDGEALLAVLTWPGSFDRGSQENSCTTSLSSSSPKRSAMRQALDGYSNLQDHVDESVGIP
jgi:hypothetical protein